MWANQVFKKTLIDYLLWGKYRETDQFSQICYCTIFSFILEHCGTLLNLRRYQAFPHVFWCSIKIGMCVWANTSQQNSLRGRWYWWWETTKPLQGPSLLPCSPFLHSQHLLLEAAALSIHVLQKYAWWAAAKTDQNQNIFPSKICIVWEFFLVGCVQSLTPAVLLES